MTGSTRLSTNLPATRGQLSTTFAPMWITLWTAACQPPIANISIRGRSEVASDRSSE